MQPDRTHTRRYSSPCIKHGACYRLVPTNKMRISLLLIVNMTLSQEVTMVMGDGKLVPQSGLESQHHWRYSALTRLLRLKAIALKIMTQVMPLGRRLWEAGRV